MSKSKEAVARFAEGFSCSQAVFSTYAAESGLDRDTALKIASGFGGGIGGLGQTCGAVSGAIMALGLKHGTTTADRAAKETIYAKVRQFTERFQQRNGSLLCRDLLGCDISTAEGRQHARDAGLFQQKCPKLVEDAAEILEQIG
jgi:C_GCAxxG_C_C family probable redox protein